AWRALIRSCAGSEEGERTTMTDHGVPFGVEGAVHDRGWLEAALPAPYRRCRPLGRSALGYGLRSPGRPRDSEIDGKQQERTNPMQDPTSTNRPRLISATPRPRALALGIALIAIVVGLIAPTGAFAASMAASTDGVSTTACAGGAWPLSVQ